MTDEEKKAQEEKELAELKAKYGDEIVAHKSSFGWLVFGPPDPDAYDDFLDEASRDKGKKSAMLRSLCLRSVLHPSRDELREIFKKRAGLPTVIGGKLVELACDSAQELSKKD
jgi:hypothetical protein